MGPYPQYLKERITSKTGHMSNSDTAEFWQKISPNIYDISGYAI